LFIYLGTDDPDTESTDETETGVVYRRRIAASSIDNNSVLQCSMEFKQAVRPTGTLPGLIFSKIPPNYTVIWNSQPVIVIGEYVRH